MFREIVLALEAWRQDWHEIPGLPWILSPLESSTSRTECLHGLSDDLRWLMLDTLNDSQIRLWSSAFVDLERERLAMGDTWP